ncbi:MAG: hypothetical protein K1Y02_17695 [Candidatus Hydrogenedentes bacterium]|nr:hypothetical protein [Candidatus Hydrogenedentota bacterium]
MNYPKLDSLRSKALIACGAGVIVSLLGLFISGKTQFFQSYLYAFMLWNGLSLGCLSLLMLHHMVAGRWGFMIQRFLEAGTRILPIMLLLFLPILLYGVYILYPWAPGGALAHHEIIQAKAAFLNITGFRIRALIYFAVWIALSFLLTRLSIAQDKDGDPARTLRLRWISGPGIVAQVLTITFAMTDWGMSLEPEWFSTIYAPIFIVGQGLGALALCIIILSKVADTEPHSKVMSVDFYHHLGGLLCAFTVVWTYFSFSQYLITWSGNLPEEIPWYLHRTGPGLNLIALTLMLFNFALPMFILFQRRVKRSARALVFMAMWVFLARFVDVFWIIKPAFTPNRLGIHILDFSAHAAIGGLWLFLFVTQIKKYPLLPLHDQRMEAALGGHEHGEEAVEHA